MSHPTFIGPEEVIRQHKDGTLDPRQGIVALARELIALREEMRSITTLLLERTNDNA